MDIYVIGCDDDFKSYLQTHQVVYIKNVVFCMLYQRENKKSTEFILMSSPLEKYGNQSREDP